MNANALLEALGGAGNVKSVLVRSSRLLLDVISVERLDDAALSRLGVRGVARIAPTAAHVILGPTAEAMAQEMDNLLTWNTQCTKRLDLMTVAIGRRKF